MLSPTLTWTRPLNPLTSDVERLFQSVFPGFSPTARRAAFPAVNAWEDAEALHLEAEVPGIPMEQIELTVDGDELTIKGRREAPGAGPRREVLRSERWTGQFERTITLPVPVDAENVGATLVNGVLSVTLPKAQGARARRIEIKPGVAR